MAKFNDMSKKAGKKGQGGIACCTFIFAAAFAACYAYLAFANREYDPLTSQRCCASVTDNAPVKCSAPKGNLMAILQDTAKLTADTATGLAATGAAATGNEEVSTTAEDLQTSLAANMQFSVSDTWRSLFLAYFLLSLISVFVSFMMCCGQKIKCCGSLAACVNCLLALCSLAVLIFGLVSRFSKPGQVCSGDLRDWSSTQGMYIGTAPEGTQWYPMSGMWLKVILYVQLVCFVLNCCCACCAFGCKGCKKGGDDSD